MKFQLPTFFRVDITRKLVALAIALLLWYYVNEQLHEVERYHDIPVELRYDSTSLWIEKERIMVNVTLQGSRKRLQKIQSSDIRGAVNVPAVPAGVYFYDLHLSAENFILPLGTRMTEITPANQLIPVDAVEIKRGVPIKIRFNGKLREGYQQGKVTVVPSVVDLRGPSKILREIKEILTEPVPLDETLTQGFEMEVKLVLLSRVFTNSESAHVQVEISRQIMQQSYKDLPLYVMATATDRLEPAEPLPAVTVTLQGPQNLLETIDSFAVRPFVDISAVQAPGRYRRPVQIWVGGAATVTVEYIYPNMVDVVLSERDRSSAVKEP